MFICYLVRFCTFISILQYDNPPSNTKMLVAAFLSHGYKYGIKVLKLVGISAVFKKLDQALNLAANRPNRRGTNHVTCKCFRKESFIYYGQNRQDGLGRKPASQQG